MASLDITVKTLDSQNHKFNISEDKTVKEFKEEIEKVINIPANVQRLIYCGRVLADEKPLKDYDLDKKAVHLVQRVPSSQRPPHPSGASSSARSSATNSPRRVHVSTARGFDTNTLEMIHLAAHNRINLVNHMLTCAENCVARLEDPNATPPPPADHINFSALAQEGDSPFSAPEVAGTLTTSISMGDQLEGANSNSLGGAVTAAVAGALSAIVTAVNTSMGGSITVGAPNITVTSMSSDVPMDSPPHPGPTPLEDTSEPAAASATSTASAASSSETRSNPERPASATSSTPSAAQQRPRRGSPISVMADAIDRINRIQDRLRPFSDQLTRTMRDDPVFVGENNNVEEVQRQFSLMSETMHFISHAYHHLSDLSLGLARPPPRTLGVRSLVLQPAFVQGVGFPLQAQFNYVSGRLSPPGSSPSTAASPTPPATASPTRPASGSPAPASTSSTPAQESIARQLMPELIMGPAAFESRRSSFTLPSGSNVEVVMEMSPGSLAYVPGSMGGMHAHTHHVQEASPDLMRAFIMHAVNQQLGGAVANAPASTSNTPTAGVPAGAAPSSGGNSGQNSQARGTTTTNPTTSTQTRSTPRPHVHLAPVNVPVSNMFDPYLVCSSHHTHIRRRQVEPTQTTTASSTATQSGPANQTRQPAAAAVTTAAAAATLAAAPQQPRPPAVPNISAGQVDDMLRRSFMEILPPDSFANWRMPTINWPTSPGQEESVFSAIINSVTQNLTLEDILQLSLQQGTPLSRIRAPIRDIVNRQLMRGESATPENLNRAVDRIMHEIPVVNMLQGSNQLRPGINLQESFRRFYRDQLTAFLELINSESITPNQFGPRLLGFSGQFLRYLTSLVLLCCRDGRRGLEDFVHSTVSRLIPSNATPVPISVQHGRNSMSTYFLSMQIDTAAVERYVQRLPTAPDSTASIPAESQTATPRTAASEEAMECDEEFVLAAEELPTQQAAPPIKEEEEGATVLPPLETEANATCNVVVGAEEWHTGLETDWVPVISRDIQRQRRQTEQPPFSDSYLSGMSSKRRKLVSNGKPQGGVNQVIAKAVANAATTIGIPNTEQLAKAAGSDSGVQAAYKEEVKKCVQQQLSLNPDFTAERYPNANKYFKPTKQ
ncbi:large proline-rich protein BAG6 [Cloeon dipterum]|uniref:large proline-rich protein BAG6 n=1 Tax=Cloeon dipterum TaxID=197152 RepID=UPI003220083D